MDNKDWFLYVVDHHEGPFTVNEIRKRVKKGAAKSSSYVWKDGLEDWVMMSDSTEFGAGASTGDAHGRFAFITGIPSKLKDKVKLPSFSLKNLFKRKKAGDPSASGTAAAAAAAAAADSDAAPIKSGPDATDVRPSDSVWCLNSQKQFTGPHSMKSIIRKINEWEVSVEDSVWKDGWSSFVRISNIPTFMEEVKPDVLTGKPPKKKKKASAEAKANAAAMGMGGKASVRSYLWYKSRKVMFVFLFCGPFALYQMLVLGQLNPLLEKAPGAKEFVAAKIKEFNLKPVPTWQLNKYIDQGVDALRPYLPKLVAYLPDALQGYISAIQIPDGFTQGDAENFREISAADIKHGIQLASAFPPGEEGTPSFYVASNAPDGLTLTVTLRGIENTLLGAISYEKSVDVTVAKHIAPVPPFTTVGNKPIPRGEYMLLVYESDKQTNPEVVTLLAASPKPKPPSLIPQNKVAFVVDHFFLGGKRDASYETKLKEFHDKMNVSLGAETFELKQFALELERMANESATKYGGLAAEKSSPQRTAKWNTYNTSYEKSSTQIKTTVTSKTADAAIKDSVVPQLWKKLAQTYQLTEALHQTETDAIVKGASPDAVNAQAGKTVESIAELKAGIFKYIK